MNFATNRLVEMLTHAGHIGHYNLSLELIHLKTRLNGKNEYQIHDKNKKLICSMSVCIFHTVEPRFNEPYPSALPKLP